MFALVGYGATIAIIMIYVIANYGFSHERLENPLRLVSVVVYTDTHTTIFGLHANEHTHLCMLYICTYIHCTSHAHSLTQSLRSLTHCLTPSLNHSPTHSFIHSLTHCLTPSLTHSLTPSLNHSLTASLPHSITHPPTHSLTTSRSLPGSAGTGRHHGPHQHTAILSHLLQDGFLHLHYCGQQYNTHQLVLGT